MNIRHKRGARLLTLLLGLALALPAAAERVENRAMTLALSIGERAGVYTGELENGLPEGTGVFVSRNEDGVAWTYEGRFEKGEFQGQGRLAWEDGDVMEGTFADSRLNGQGVYTRNGALVYEGGWKDGRYAGRGTVYEDDIVWKGTFTDGLLNGYGTCTKNGALLFEGEFRDNQMYTGTYYDNGQAIALVEGENRNRRILERLLITVLGLFTFAAVGIGAGVIYREARKRRRAAVLAAARPEEPAGEPRAAMCENCRASSWVRPGEEAECPYCGSPLSWQDGE